jgi:hypothetical protein
VVITHGAELGKSAVMKVFKEATRENASAEMCNPRGSRERSGMSVPAHVESGKLSQLFEGSPVAETNSALVVERITGLELLEALAVWQARGA